MLNRAATAYRKVDLESAPKSQIVERLFERARRDVTLARDAVTRNDLHGKAAAIDHALRIVGELEASLDHAAAPELCANLAALYAFVAGRLTRANQRLDPKLLDEADRILGDLADAFRAAHAAYPGAPPPGSPGTRPGACP